MSNRPTRRPSSSARVSQARAEATGGRTTWWLIGGAVVIIALALVVAVVATTRGGDSGQAARPIAGGGTVVPPGSTVYGDVRVTGTPLSPATGGADPTIGQPAPEVSGQQFSGAPLTIPAAGKPKVVIFLAHWCPHCQAEVPRIAEYLADKGMPNDVDLYAVATSTTETRGNYPPASWLRRENWPVPTIADDKDSKAATAFGLTGFPFFVVVDAQGKVVNRTSGEKSVEQFQAMLDEARTGKATGKTG